MLAPFLFNNIIKYFLFNNIIEKVDDCKIEQQSNVEMFFLDHNNLVQRKPQ
jgi:hypothetical protein